MDFKNSPKKVRRVSAISQKIEIRFQKIKQFKLLIIRLL